MTDALEDHEVTASAGGRTITNLRFADDISGLTGKKEEVAKLAESLPKSLHTLRHGDKCRKDQVDDKQHQRHQQEDQNNRTES